MSVSVFLTNDIDQDKPRIVSMNVGGYYEIFSSALSVIEKTRPDIFEKAFESVSWGEVRIDNLNAEEFKLVYDQLVLAYSKYEQHRATVPPAERNSLDDVWGELIEKLRDDPRLKDASFSSTDA